MDLVPSVVQTLRSYINCSASLLICVHSTDMLLRANRWGKPGCEGKGVGFSSLFLTSVTIFTASGCLINGGDKGTEGYDGVHWLFVFLRMSLALSVFETSSGSNESDISSQGCQHPPLILAGDVTHLTLTLGLAELRDIVSPLSVCALEHPKRLMSMAAESCLLGAPSCCCPVRFHFQTSRLRRKKKYQEFSNSDWRALSHVPTHLLRVGSWNDWEVLVSLSLVGLSLKKNNDMSVAPVIRCHSLYISSKSLKVLKTVHGNA